MNAIRHLLREHEGTGKLFNQFVDAGEEAYKQKQAIAEKVIEEIGKHARLEDEILFPALKEEGDEIHAGPVPEDKGGRLKIRCQVQSVDGKLKAPFHGRGV